MDAQRLGEFVDGQRIGIQRRQMPQDLERLGAHRQTAVLEHDTGKKGSLVVAAVRVEPEDLDLTGIRRPRAHGQRDRRRLACTIGAEHTEDGSGGGIEVDSVDDVVCAVRVMETTNGEGRF